MIALKCSKLLSTRQQGGIGNESPKRSNMSSVHGSSAGSNAGNDDNADSVYADESDKKSMMKIGKIGIMLTALLKTLTAMSHSTLPVLFAERVTGSSRGTEEEEPRQGVVHRPRLDLEPFENRAHHAQPKLAVGHQNARARNTADCCELAAGWHTLAKLAPPRYRCVLGLTWKCLGCRTVRLPADIWSITILEQRASSCTWRMDGLWRRPDRAWKCNS